MPRYRACTTYTVQVSVGLTFEAADKATAAAVVRPITEDTSRLRSRGRGATTHGSDIHVMLGQRFRVTVDQNASSWHRDRQPTMIVHKVCPRCKSAKYKKNGHVHNGKQNHYCHDCGRQFVQCCEQYLLSEETRGSANACWWSGFHYAAFVAPRG
jgi:hypothetical protein